MQPPCKHKFKHTKMIDPKPGIMLGYIIWHDFHTLKVPATDGLIIIYCADCGSELKRTVVPFKNN